jgi:hypothetical protein
MYNKSSSTLVRSLRNSTQQTRSLFRNASNLDSNVNASNSTDTLADKLKQYEARQNIRLQHESLRETETSSTSLDVDEKIDSMADRFKLGEAKEWSDQQTLDSNDEIEPPTATDNIKQLDERRFNTSEQQQQSVTRDHSSMKDGGIRGSNRR